MLKTRPVLFIIAYIVNCLFAYLSVAFMEFYQFFIPDPLNVLLGSVIDLFFNLKEIKDIYSDVIVTMLE